MHYVYYLFLVVVSHVILCKVLVLSFGGCFVDRKFGIWKCTPQHKNMKKHCSSFFVSYSCDVACKLNIVWPAGSESLTPLRFWYFKVLDKFESNLGWVSSLDNRFLRTFVAFVQLPGLPVLQHHGLRESTNSGRDPLRLDQPLCCSSKRPPGSGPRFVGGRGQFGGHGRRWSWPQELFERGDLKTMKSLRASGVGGIGNWWNWFLRNILLYVGYFLYSRCHDSSTVAHRLVCLFGEVLQPVARMHYVYYLFLVVVSHVILCKVLVLSFGGCFVDRKFGIWKCTPQHKNMKKHCSSFFVSYSCDVACKLNIVWPAGSESLNVEWWLINPPPLNKGSSLIKVSPPIPPRSPTSPPTSKDSKGIRKGLEGYSGFKRFLQDIIPGALLFRIWVL